MAAGDRAGSEKRSWARALQPIEVKLIEVFRIFEVPTQRRQRSAGCSRERERLEGDDDRRTIDKKVAGRGLI
eukprot:SAG25_NODE_62_length_17948_cov_8.453975_5_plen_72_part_00